MSKKCSRTSGGSKIGAALRPGGARSAVSRHITNLQLQLVAPLFDLTTGPVTLTPVGQILRQHARWIPLAAAVARIVLMAPRLESLIGLRPGIIDDLVSAMAPDLVVRLRQRWPRGQVTTKSGRSDDLYSVLPELTTWRMTPA